MINDDDDYSGFSEDDDKKEASNPNCLDYSTDEDDEDNYIFDPDLEEFELVDLSDPNKGSKKIRGRPRGNIGGPQPPDYSTMNPVDKKMAEDELIGKGGDGVPKTLVTLTLENIRYSVAMGEQPMQICHLLHLRLSSAMKTEPAGQNFGSMLLNFILRSTQATSPSSLIRTKVR